MLTNSDDTLITNTSFPVTGTQLSKVEDPTDRTESSVWDLHVYKDTLIVPKCWEKKVLFYQLN